MLLSQLINLYSLVVMASVVLSWIQLPADNPLVRGVNALTEPVLEPIRRVLPSLGGFDLSPMVLFVALRLLGRALLRF